MVHIFIVMVDVMVCLVDGCISIPAGVLSVRGNLPSYDPFPPPPHTVYVYTVYLFTMERGGGVNQREVRWATVHKAGSKIPT